MIPAAAARPRPPDRLLQLDTKFPPLPKIKKSDIFDGSDISSVALVLGGYVSEVPILRRLFEGAEPPEELQSDKSYNGLRRAYDAGRLSFSSNAIPLSFETNDERYGTSQWTGIYVPTYDSLEEPMFIDNNSLDAEWAHFADNGNDDEPDPVLHIREDGTPEVIMLPDDVVHDFDADSWREARLRSMAAYYDNLILQRRRQEYQAGNSRFYNLVILVIRRDDHPHIRAHSRDGKNAWAALKKRFAGADNTRAGLMSSIIGALLESFKDTDTSTTFLDRLGKCITRVKNHDIVNRENLSVPDFLDILLLALATSKIRQVDKYSNIVSTLNTQDNLNVEIFTNKILEWERGSGLLDEDGHNKRRGDHAASARAMHGAFAANELESSRSPPPRGNNYQQRRNNNGNRRPFIPRYGNKTAAELAEEECWNHVRGTCDLGNRCPRQHIGEAGRDPNYMRRPRPQQRPQQRGPRNQGRRERDIRGRFSAPGRGNVNKGNGNRRPPPPFHETVSYCSDMIEMGQGVEPGAAGNDDAVYDEYATLLMEEPSYDDYNNTNEIALMSTTPTNTEDDWLMDSGAKRHYLKREPWWFKRLHRKPIIGTAGGGVLRGTSKGNIPPSKEGQFPLDGCMHAPGIVHNLVSVGSMCDKLNGGLYHTSDGVYAVPAGDIQTSNYQQVARRGPDTGHMYRVNREHFGIDDLSEKAMILKENPAKVFHEKMGHPNPQLMAEILRKKLVLNPGYTHHDLDSWDAICAGCNLGKARRLPHSSSWESATGREVWVMFDCFGKMSKPTMDGHRYMLLFVCWRSKMTYCQLLKKESELPSAIDAFLYNYHRQFGHLPSALFCDGAKVHLSSTVKAILDKRLIKQFTTTPHGSEQNPAETYIGIICNKARTLLQAAGLGLEFWGYAVKEASYLHNRTPNKNNPQHMSPYEMEFGVKPDVSRIERFGSTVYVTLPHDGREHARDTSLDAAAAVGTLVGHAARAAGYIVYMPHTKRIWIRRHVRFHPPGSSPPTETDDDFRHRRRQERLGDAAIDGSPDRDFSFPSPVHSGSGSVVSSDDDDGSTIAEPVVPPPAPLPEPDMNAELPYEDKWTQEYAASDDDTLEDIARRNDLDPLELQSNNLNLPGKAGTAPLTMKLKAGTGLWVPAGAVMVRRSHDVPVRDAAKKRPSSLATVRGARKRLKRACKQARIDKALMTRARKRAPSSASSLRRNDIVGVVDNASPVASSGTTPDTSSFSLVDSSSSRGPHSVMVHDGSRGPLLTLKQYQAENSASSHRRKRGLDKSLRITIQQENMKTGEAGARYEKYKKATTIQEMLDLGGTMADLHWDMDPGRQFTKLAAASGDMSLSTTEASVYPDTTELRNTKTRDIKDPANTAESRKSPYAKYWQAACNVEMKQLIEKGVLEPITEDDIPRLIRDGTISRRTAPIPCRYVFKAKSDKDGNLKRFKARLVAKGFYQKKGVHYDETFAPCISIQALKMLISFATTTKMELFQYDVEGAFLHPKLDEPLILVDEEGQMYVCYHTIYGLKQSAHFWNRDLHRELERLGMKRSEVDQCLYSRETEKGTLIMGVWVDDVVGAATNRELIDDFLKEFSYNFSEGGEFDHILRIRIFKDGDTVGLNQAAAIEDIAVKYKMQDANPVATPMVLNEVFSKEQMPEEGTDEALLMNKTPYRNLLGSLMYISGITRPDIAKSVNVLAQFASNPGQIHWKALKRILNYLHSTKDRKLTYGVDAAHQREWLNDPNHQALSFYVDANHGGCKDTGRSTTGLICVLNGDCVHHKCNRQKKVCNSTAAAELYAVAKAARKADEIRRIYFHLSNYWQKRITIYTDSQVVKKMLERGTMTNTTKHLHLAFHEIKELIDSGSIKLVHIAGTDNPSDLLTKPLGRVVHEKHTGTILRDDYKAWKSNAS